MTIATDADYHRSTTVISAIEPEQGPDSALIVPWSDGEGSDNDETATHVMLMKQINLELDCAAIILFAGASLASRTISVLHRKGRICLSRCYEGSTDLR